MYHTTRARLTARLIRQTSRLTSSSETEEGFEIAQSMGIALLGLVVAAAFSTLLTDLGGEIVEAIRGQLGM